MQEGRGASPENLQREGEAAHCFGSAPPRGYSFPLLLRGLLTNE